MLVSSCFNLSYEVPLISLLCTLTLKGGRGVVPAAVIGGLGVVLEGGGGGLGVVPVSGGIGV